MESLADDLALLERTARDAGEIALRFFDRKPKVWWKPGNSPVSEADYAVDDYLRRTLLDARPGYGWVSEEMQAGHARDGSGRFFIVDPIDGTRAYLRGETTWCVSIAVIENGRPIAGAIAATALDSFLSASRDGPALMNGRPISASDPRDDDALHLAVPSGMRKELEEAGNPSFVPEPVVPSLAYRLALVASGALDGTLVRARANDWDIAAADVIIERAGGLLCDLRGKPMLYTSTGRRHGPLAAGSVAAIPRLLALASHLPVS